jgi:hypothetical protein
MTLNDFGLDPEHLFALIFGLVWALLFWRYDNRFRQGAKTHDHVAEIGRDLDPLIPPRCLGCGSHHASHPVKVRRYIHGVSPIAVTMNPSFKRRFTFGCCLECARPIRRRRRFGRTLMTAGYLFGIHIALAIGVAVAIPGSYQAADKLLPQFRLGWLFNVSTWPFEIIAGTVLVSLGFWMTIYSPYVTVLDTGGRTIFFRFRNQHYRDAFAALNGEEVQAV